MLVLVNRRPGRFLKWSRARALVRRIRACLDAGGRVVVGTYTKATEYGPKHADWFKAEPSGAYVRRGKGWECIDLCGFRFTK